VAIFYADENVSSLLNDALRLYGHAIFATHDEGRSGATDGSQLLYAAERGWIILTHNRADFIMRHDAWHLWARAWDIRPEHAGIGILEPVEPSRYADIAALIHDVCQRNELTNTLLAWRGATGWERNPRR
jgi:hypothetical protein